MTKEWLMLVFQALTTPAGLPSDGPVGVAGVYSTQTECIADITNQRNKLSPGHKVECRRNNF
jgi:hypothetical protein